MPKLIFEENTTTRNVRIFIQDSTSTTGAGLTGLVYNSAGLVAYYFKESDNTPTQIPLVNTLIGNWLSGGFIEISAANMPGVYELGLPNTVYSALAAGVASDSVVMLHGATNMAPLLLEIQMGLSISRMKGVYLSSMPELTGVPSATPHITEAIMLWYQKLRNEATTTATEDKIRKDDGTVIATAPVSDDGTTFTKGEYV